MIAAITGHRPEKIDNRAWVDEALAAAFELLNVQHVVQGMASGVDLWSAKVAYEMGIPYTCARPWSGHQPRKADTKLYQQAIEHSWRVVDVDPSIKYPGPWVYQVRNKWMVDNSSFVISVWDGSEGGTYNCIQHAFKVGKDVFNCNPKKKVCDFLVQT